MAETVDTGAADATESVDTAPDADPVKEAIGPDDKTVDAAEADAAETVKQAFTPFKKKLKTKSGEKEVEYKTEEELVRDLQRGRYMAEEREAAAKERTEAAKERAEAKAQKEAVAELLTMLKDPRQAKQVYRHLGVDPTEMSKAMLKEAIEEQAMTPAERELAELKAWREQKLQEEQEAQQKQDAEKLTRAEQEQLDYYGNVITNVLKKVGISPASGEATEAARRIAWKIEQQLMHEEDLSEDELADAYMEDLRSEHTSLFKGAEGRALFEMLGEDGLKKVNEYAASRLKKTPSVLKPSPGGAKGTQEVMKFKNKAEREAYWSKLEEIAEREREARGGE